MRLGFLWFHFNHSDSYSHGLVLGTIIQGSTPYSMCHSVHLMIIKCQKLAVTRQACSTTQTDVIIEGREMEDYFNKASSCIHMDYVFEVTWSLLF